MPIRCLPLVTAAGSPGLLDPCEKDPFDTLATMTEQQREDITSSAQVRKGPAQRLAAVTALQAVCGVWLVC